MPCVFYSWCIWLRSQCRLHFHLQRMQIRFMCTGFRDGNAGSVALTPANHRIPTARVSTPSQDTGTLPAVRVTAKREVCQSVHEESFVQMVERNSRASTRWIAGRFIFSGIIPVVWLVEIKCVYGRRNTVVLRRPYTQFLPGRFMFPKLEYGEHCMPRACIHTNCSECSILNLAIWLEGWNFATGSMTIDGVSLHLVYWRTVTQSRRYQ
jgi:hypothetical protein